MAYIMHIRHGVHHHGDVPHGVEITKVVGSLGGGSLTHDVAAACAHVTTNSKIHENKQHIAPVIANADALQVQNTNHVGHAVNISAGRASDPDRTVG